MKITRRQLRKLISESLQSPISQEDANKIFEMWQGCDKENFVQSIELYKMITGSDIDFWKEPCGDRLSWQDPGVVYLVAPLEEFIDIPPHVGEKEGHVMHPLLYHLSMSPYNVEFRILNWEIFPDRPWPPTREWLDNRLRVYGDSEQSLRNIVFAIERKNLENKGQGG